MLKEQIQNDLKRALKEKKERELSVLRMLNSAILNKEKEKRYKISQEKPQLEEKELEKESQLSDEEIISVISSEIKKRKEAISEFEKGKREDLIEKEKREIEILERYLPEPLSEEEVKMMAQEIIEKTGVKEIREMGKVMAQLMPKIKGRIEGQKASQIVRELLIQN